MKWSTLRASPNFHSCTWNNFSSLAICSKCLNITSSVEKTCNDVGCYELSLPGLMLFGFGGQINTSVSQISTSLDDIEASVVRFSSLFSKRTNDSNDVQAVRHFSKIIFLSETALGCARKVSRANHPIYRPFRSPDMRYNSSL